MTEFPTITNVGFDPDEINTSESTRSARLKWVIVVNESLPAGRGVNAAVCVASATAVSVRGLLGPEAKDGAGSTHPGLPWAGCSILVAPTEKLSSIRAKAKASIGVYVADMPSQAQNTRVYDEYLEQISGADPTGLDYYAVSIVGPRNRIDKIAGKLPLLP